MQFPFSYWKSSLLEKLSAYWTFNDPTLTATGLGLEIVNGYNFDIDSLFGAATSQPGILNKALEITNITLYSLATTNDPNQAALDFSSEWSFTFWVYSASDLSNISYPLTKQNGSGGWLMGTTGGNWFFWLLDGSGGFAAQVTSTGATWANNTWFFIAVTIKDNQVKIRINNGAVATGNFTATPQPAPGSALELSISSVAIRFDEMSMWNKALTDEEQTRLYNNGLGLSWPF